MRGDPQGEERKAVVFALFEKLVLERKVDPDSFPSFGLVNRSLAFHVSAQERDDLWAEFKESP
jgi:hypothetical protein